MQVKLHKLFTDTAAGLRFAATSLLLFVNVFFARAQYTDASVRLFFPFDSPVLSEKYMSNSAAMATLDSLVAKLSDGENLSIITFSSPEGNFAYNLNLSRNRAESVRKYIVAKYPALSSRITVNSESESWNELRQKVQSDARLSSAARAQVLDIIDSQNSPDKKEALLKANSAYKSLYSNYFRGLRYADISLRIKNLAQDAPRHTNAETSATKQGESNANAGVSANRGTKATGEPIVYFALNEDFIRPGYMNNSENLKVIRRILSDPSNRDKEIVLEGAASPEGPLSINKRLGISRAQTLANWLVGQFPDLEGRIVVRSKGEDWEGLREGVENSTTLSAQEKDELLAIIDSDNTPAKKESLLKAHSAYSIVNDEIFPYIRYARIAGLKPAEDPAGNGDTTAAIIPVDTVATAPADTTAVLPVKDTTTAITPTDGTGNVIGNEGSAAGAPVSYVRGKNTIVALKTNLLYDAVTALNFEIEVPISDRFSIMAEDVFPWWETGNKYCFQLWEMGVEARYWFKPWKTVGTEKLRGLFVGPYVMSGKYDFQNDKSINYQGEFWSAGVTAGYAMPIGKRKRANLEFSLSLGYLESPYRHYIPTDDYSKLIHDPNRDGKFYDYFLYPTKAKVSLVVPLNIPTKKEVSHE